ncbi:MAG: biotin--[acetyl-CoA-carboxylase] ligase [Clostridiales bacterium]|nr:biotin--[acetyl-CoA-carboxylase] ligase [Clostridiales bacterium]
MNTDKDYLDKIDDNLSEQGIRNYLSSKLADLRIEVFNSVDSTNDLCKRNTHHNTKTSDLIKYIAIAEHQTQGRGSRGRSFFSPSNTGLYMSILIANPPYSIEEATKFTTMAAVSVCKAIEEISGKKSLIKWVNDIYVSKKKVCGILTEASPNLTGDKLEYAVIGIGINVYPPATGFPEDIEEKAGAIFETRITDVRNHLVASIINHFVNYYESDSKSNGKKNSYTDEYRRRCFILGKEVLVITESEIKKATAINIDNSCRLIVRYDNGNMETLYSGEIKLHSLSEYLN